VFGVGLLVWFWGRTSAASGSIRDEESVVQQKQRQNEAEAYSAAPQEETGSPFFSCKRARATKVKKQSAPGKDVAPRATARRSDRPGIVGLTLAASFLLLRLDLGKAKFHERINTL
jgi:hypothetical protein